MFGQVFSSLTNNILGWSNITFSIVSNRITDVATGEESPKIYVSKILVHPIKVSSNQNYAEQHGLIGDLELSRHLSL